MTGTVHQIAHVSAAAVIGTGLSGSALTSQQDDPPACDAQGPPLPELGIIALNRLGFGPSPKDLESWRNLPGDDREKLAVWVEQQLDPHSIDDSECDRRLADLSTLNKPIEQLWQDHYRKAPEGDQKYVVIYQPVEEVKAATLLRAVHSRRQLQEVLADFWHNHFNVSPHRSEEIAPVFPSYDREVIRRHLLGNFRDMLEAVAMHPAMLFYLDNAANSRNGPNENWARELFELHTLGAGAYLGVMRQKDVPGFGEGQPVGYVDDDVYEATRAFTGWRVNDNQDEWQPGMEDTGTFRYYDMWHDRFQKSVLGRYLPPDQKPMKDGRDVLDALATHPATGRFIAHKLACRLIGDHPPEALVDQAAALFTAQSRAPDQIRQVVRLLLRSDAFANTWGDKLKRPFEAWAAMLRASGAQIREPFRTVGKLWQMGQPLFGRVPPDGYPDHKAAWSGTSSMLERWRHAEGLSWNWWEDELYTDLQGQTPPEVRSPGEIVEFWSRRLLGYPLHAAVQQHIIEAAYDGRDPHHAFEENERAWAIPLVVSAILMSPDFQWR